MEVKIMTNVVKTSPTPIQRNKFDVAIELTQLQRQLGGLSYSEDIEKTFAKYYALAILCENANYEQLLSFVSEDFGNKLK
jgi:hypothetical protein